MGNYCSSAHLQEDRGLLPRAFAAYFKKRRPLVQSDEFIDQPSRADSGVTVHDGKVM